jgi:hypothetical protein
LLKATVEWYRIYKIPDGKPENKFAFNGEAKNREFALHVIEDVHKFWQALHTKEVDAGGMSLYVFLAFNVNCNRLLNIPIFVGPQPLWRAALSKWNWWMLRKSSMTVLPWAMPCPLNQVVG